MKRVRRPTVWTIDRLRLTADRLALSSSTSSSSSEVVVVVVVTVVVVVERRRPSQSRTPFFLFLSFRSVSFWFFFFFLFAREYPSSPFPLARRPPTATVARAHVPPAFERRRCLSRSRPNGSRSDPPPGGSHIHDFARILIILCFRCYHHDIAVYYAYPMSTVGL